MTQIEKESSKLYRVNFCPEELNYFMPDQMQFGIGKNTLTRLRVKEIMACVAKELKKYKVNSAQMDISLFIEKFSVDILHDIIEGFLLGTYEPPKFPAKEIEDVDIDIVGIPEEVILDGEKRLQETLHIVMGVCFARDMVNMPGNKLRPLDFAQNIKSLYEGLPVECEVFETNMLRELGMNGILEIGESSAYEPCFVIIKYIPEKDSMEKLGLVGKGITCDTGGYCLKKSDSMLGIKGDMAGGAAVAGAIYALAKNAVKKNVIGFIPICENRISPGSLLPGDVYTAFDGTTVEVQNTDAEGRLVLADAVAYAVGVEKVSKVLDIATLTGAVVNMLGFSIAGVLCDDDSFYKEFEEAYKMAGEQYLRLPFMPEHEKMIESKVADIKNMGEKYCGTITAGLFIRKFAKKTPWIHLDIAGTAWVDSPVFEFQTSGATGAGVSSLYYLCCQKGY